MIGQLALQSRSSSLATILAFVRSVKDLPAEFRVFRDMQQLLDGLWRQARKRQTGTGHVRRWD